MASLEFLDDAFGNMIKSYLLATVATTGYTIYQSMSKDSDMEDKNVFEQTAENCTKCGSSAGAILSTAACATFNTPLNIAKSIFGTATSATGLGGLDNVEPVLVGVANGILNPIAGLTAASASLVLTIFGQGKSPLVILGPSVLGVGMYAITLNTMGSSSSDC